RIAPQDAAPSIAAVERIDHQVRLKPDTTDETRETASVLLPVWTHGGRHARTQQQQAARERQELGQAGTRRRTQEQRRAQVFAIAGGGGRWSGVEGLVTLALDQRPWAGHVRGSVPRKLASSASSRSISIGFTRCRSNPAASARRRSSGWPYPVNATSSIGRAPSVARMRRATS